MIDATVPTLVLDSVLVGAGIASALVARKVFRGRVSLGFVFASAGLIALGFGHLLETLMWLGMRFIGDEAIELTHRSIILTGFSLLVFGLGRIGRELWREWDRVIQANAALIVAEDDLRLVNEELRERNRQLLDAYSRVSGRKEPIRLLIAIADPAQRRILASLLAHEADIHLAGESATAEEVRATAGRLSPEVVLVDDSLADQALIASLKSSLPSGNIVVLGTYRSGALDALAAGAADYVLKDAGFDRLTRAIRDVERASPQMEVDSEIGA